MPGRGPYTIQENSCLNSRLLGFSSFYSSKFLKHLFKTGHNNCFHQHSCLSWSHY